MSVGPGVIDDTEGMTEEEYFRGMEDADLKKMQQGEAEVSAFVGALEDGLQLTYLQIVEVVAAFAKQQVLAQETKLCRRDECILADNKIKCCPIRSECNDAELIISDLSANIRKAERAHKYHQDCAHKLELKMSQVAQ